MTAFDLRRNTLADAPAVLDLYRATAAREGSGLAREPDEMDLPWVQSFLGKAVDHGVTLGAWAGGGLAGEIHAARMGPRQFDHNLMDLTVAVRPDWQGRGVGAALFEGLFAEAAKLSPRIERIELAVREGNPGALRLYLRMGFVIEGRHPGRVRLKNGATEVDITLAKFL